MNDLFTYEYDIDWLDQSLSTGNDGAATTGCAPVRVRSKARETVSTSTTPSFHLEPEKVARAVAMAG